MNDDQIIEQVLGIEKGFVNDKADNGGPTNWGITIPVLSKWRNKTCTIDDIKALTREEAVQIYRKMYIDDWDFEKIVDDNLRWCVVDSGVHQGQPTATRLLQTAVKAEVDGHLGPVSLSAVNSLPPRLALARFVAQRAQRYGRIITEDFKKGGDDATYAAGWMNRLSVFIELLGN